MKLKMIYLKDNKFKEYYFSETISAAIVARCKAANKQWANNLVGFFINHTNDMPYLAISIATDDKMIECMEYRDVDTDKPEFSIDEKILAELSDLPAHTEIPADLFDPLVESVVWAPGKVRRWEVYPEINQRYMTVH